MNPETEALIRRYFRRNDADWPPMTPAESFSIFQATGTIERILARFDAIGVRDPSAETLLLGAACVLDHLHYLATHDDQTPTAPSGGGEGG